MAKTVGITRSYEYITDVNPNAKMLCGRTGINKKFCDLTDADIELMTAKGSKDFTRIGGGAPTTEPKKKK